MKVKLGPLSLSYKGTAKFIEKDPADPHDRHRGDGQGDPRRGHRLGERARQPEARRRRGQHAVAIHTSLNVTGRPAQFGR